MKKTVSVDVKNFPAVQQVEIVGNPQIQNVNVANLPLVQPVAVVNTPEVQNVHVTNFPELPKENVVHVFASRREKWKKGLEFWSIVGTLIAASLTLLVAKHTDENIEKVRQIEDSSNVLIGNIKTVETDAKKVADAMKILMDSTRSLMDSTRRVIERYSANATNQEKEIKVLNRSLDVLNANYDAQYGADSAKVIEVLYEINENFNSLNQMANPSPFQRIINDGDTSSANKQAVMMEIKRSIELLRPIVTFNLYLNKNPLSRLAVTTFSSSIGGAIVFDGSGSSRITSIAKAYSYYVTSLAGWITQKERMNTKSEAEWFVKDLQSHRYESF